ncbi:MAG: glycosyltransferase family 39 protein, partial [Planctomycetaceae bacterium]
MQQTSIIPRNTALSRREALLVCLLLFAAFLLRVAWFERMAVEHFDEGVYASNLWFGSESEYPHRQMYAPPLFPSAVEISISLLGPGAAGCLATSLATGIATVACIWWIARSWFGIAAGISALSLAAFSDFHIQFSRMCLTDVPVCCALASAVFMFSRVIQGHVGRYAVAAGTLTAIGWWTKYTGWLPVAICGAASLAWIVNHRKWGTSHNRVLIGWLMMASVCGLLTAPMFHQLQDSGGYAAIARNHSGYVTGPALWLTALGQHHAIQCHYDDWSTLCGLLLAVVLSQWIQWPNNAWRQATRIDRGRMTLNLTGLASLAGLASIFMGTMFALGIASVWGLLQQLRRKRLIAESSSTMPVWIMLSWITGLTMAVPMYQPFPRLA